MPFTSGVMSVSSILDNRASLTVTSPSGGVAPYLNQFQRAPDVDGVAGDFVNIGPNGASESFADRNLHPGTWYWWRALGTDSDAPPSQVTSNTVRLQTLGLADLITQAQLLALLTSVSNGQLTANQQAQLPFLATSISRFVRKWCNRQFTRATRDELYTVDPLDTLLLREFPVNTILQFRTRAEPVITIGNTDATTNQYAFVELLTTGNADTGLVATGINLLRTASGVVSSNFIDFATHATISSLATAVNAVGSGWQATALAPYTLWPTADIVPIQDGVPAMGQDLALLLIHTQFIRPTVEKDTGIVTFRPGDFEPINSQRFGPTLFSDFGDQTISGQTLGVRVKYDAGFDTIPEDLQLAVAECVWAALQHLRMNPHLLSETDGKYKWEGAQIVPFLPPYAREILDLYASHRA